MESPLRVAYFTMEIGIKAEIPTYAGGLGMLAADIMRSCADLNVHAACITMCWKHGYMRQHINLDGTQHYEDVHWNPSNHLRKLDQTITVQCEGRTVTVGAWVFELQGRSGPTRSQSDPLDRSRAGRGRAGERDRSGGGVVPIYFLDTNLQQNAPEDRTITEHLYGGDGAMRLKQEIVLGIGGVRMLRALGYSDVGTFHMNEGHAAFLTLELLRERDFKNENVKSSCAFTTHTPIPAGHDVFDYDLAWKVAGDQLPWHIREIAGQDRLSMTLLALNLSRYTCGVAQIHGEVSRRMFPGYPIDAITNGIHHPTWACSEMQSVLDHHCIGWREDPQQLAEHCREIPDDELWNAHQSAKKRLLDEVNRQTDVPFDIDHLTIVTARRVVSYKRPELLYRNLERFKEVACGRLQIIHAGNAHPSDHFAQEVIQRIIERSSLLKDCVKIVYLENYNPELAKLLVSGADVWLNTPMRLQEASGTSGMKACLNGVLNLSTLDGWWIEGYSRDAEAGWRIGPLARAADEEQHRSIDAEDVYTQLQFEVIPEYYYHGRVRWLRRMRRAIGIVGYFNTDRCVEEYLEKAWKES